MPGGTKAGPARWFAFETPFPISSFAAMCACGLARWACLAISLLVPPHPLGCVVERFTVNCQVLQMEHLSFRGRWLRRLGMLR